MNRKLLYLVNPISGTKRKSSLIALIQEKNKERELDFSIEATRQDGNYSFLKEKIEKENITDVIICGGDGSVSTVTSFLLHTNISVGIIPTGSGNGLALTAGIPYSTERALSIIFNGYSSYIDGFLINGKFSCMMCGIGNDAQVAHEFALTKVRGLKTYLKISAINYFKSKPFSFTVQTNGTTLEVDAFFITIANSNQFGNNVTIAPKASLNDGLLDFVIVKKMNKLLLPFALLHQIRGINAITTMGDDKINKNIIYFQAKDALIMNNDNAPMHIDGEPEPLVSRIAISILPNAFRLLQPSSRQGGEYR